MPLSAQDGSAKMEQVTQGANRGVVAAGHPATAAAGAAMLRAGGNAFDAVVAAALAACVSESALISLGGGGFLLAHPAAGEARLVDFFCQTPQQPAPAVDFYPIQANFGDAVQEFHVGLGAVAVPGLVAGLAHTHRRWGRLPLATVAAPAIDLARAGTPVRPFCAYVFRILEPILTAHPPGAALYAPQGKLLAAGDRLRLPALATTLERMVAEGFEGFYHGALAAQIVADCRGRGHLTAADLAQYQVIERDPLRVTYRGYELLTNPPPSSGGSLMGFTLGLLETVPVGDLAPGSPAHVAALIGAMDTTNQARATRFDPAIYDPAVAQEFLAKATLAPYAAQVQASLNQWGSKWGSTTHISVLDAEGNAASLTGSNGEGSTYVIPGTDIMLNNMLGEADLNPLGFHRWPPNQRLSSMMAPSVLLREGRPWVVLGSGGSNRIRTALAQVVSNLVDFRLELAAAVAAPRIHWEAGAFHAEPGYDSQVLGPLTQAYACTWWQRPTLYFGGVHAVGRDQAGNLVGVGDSRREGAVAWA